VYVWFLWSLIHILEKISSHCIYLFFLLDEYTLSRLHLLIRCISGAQNVVIVYYIVGAMGSYVEHNRTTTTSTVCDSLCWPVSSLSPSSYFLFFSHSIVLSKQQHQLHGNVRARKSESR
jgi:hypothetical protein